MNARLQPIAAKSSKLKNTAQSTLTRCPAAKSSARRRGARALITNPQLVLADEPTGALDSRATNSLLRLFEDINGEGQTIVMVTPLGTKAASHAKRVLFSAGRRGVPPALPRGDDGTGYVPENLRHADDDCDRRWPRCVRCSMQGSPRRICARTRGPTSPI